MNGATMKRLLLVTLMVAFTIVSFAITLNVAIDGSGQYSSIQAAIEAANNGDTILVHPGRYIENIDYIGKSITVCSLEATTNDSAYISQTIIDGNRNGSCVAFRNAEQNATIRGFTITNGTGYLTYDELTRGGGILVQTNSSVSIINCDIYNNYAGSGAGLSTLKCSIFLSGLRIHNNYSIAQGAGIMHVGANSHTPTIIYDSVNRCSVFENYGTAPVDISVIDIKANLEIYLDTLSVTPPNSFYVGRHNNLSSLAQYHDTVFPLNGYREEVNHNIFVSPDGNDNNSGLSPGEAMKTIAKAVHRIAADSLNVKSVYIMPGVYEEGGDAQIYPIPVKSFTNIIGAGSGLVTLTSSIINTLGFPRYIDALSSKNVTIRGITITEEVSSGRSGFKNVGSQTDLILSDIVISELHPNKRGALQIYQLFSCVLDSIVVRNIVTPEIGVQLMQVYNANIINSTFENIHSTYVSDDPLYSGLSMISIWVADSLAIENCEFSNISVQNDQPTMHFSVWDSMTTQDASIKINNSLFDNIRTNNDRAIFFGSNNSSNLEVNNCTFHNNYGSVAAVGLLGNVSMRNNIFYNPDANKEIVMYSPSAQQQACNLNVDYSYIRGGIANIQNTSFLNTLAYGEHNLSEGSLFASTTAGSANYLRLADASPCIDAGTPDISGLSLLPYDLAGNMRVWNSVIDMGCYEFGAPPAANDDPVIPQLSGGISATNYPNPFNPETTIRFQLPVGGLTELGVYNLKGQLVRKLLYSDMAAGTHTVQWDGRDKHNQPVSSGMYLYRIVSGKQQCQGKMVLMK